MYLESTSFICYLFPSRKTTWVQDAQMFPPTITSNGSLGEYMLLVPTTLDGVGLEVLVPRGEYMPEDIPGVSLLVTLTSSRVLCMPCVQGLPWKKVHCHLGLLIIDCQKVGRCTMKIGIYQVSKPSTWLFIQFSLSVMSYSLWPHGVQHARLPCPSPAPRVFSNSCPSCWWCHPTISSSVVPFSSCFLLFYPVVMVSGYNHHNLSWAELCPSHMLKLWPPCDYKTETLRKW